MCIQFKELCQKVAATSSKLRSKVLEDDPSRLTPRNNQVVLKIFIELFINFLNIFRACVESSSTTEKHLMIVKELL